MDAEVKTPKVTLLTWTQYPLETVFSVWEASKTEDPLRTPEQIKAEVEPEEIEKLFRAVILQKIPIGEHIHFVFMLENVSVSWREQAVRHRIGTNPSPERVGSDIVMMDKIPDLADSSWWSQSMRIMDMSKFADKKAYRLPETVRSHPDSEVQERYDAAHKVVQDTYAWLVHEKGIPMEDARELIGLGAHHRISWDLNIGSLGHIVGHRGCWILQLGIWGPVIQGMVDELATKVHPDFREMVSPPCVKDNKFTECVYHEECRRRYTGDDALPPCPLHVAHHHPIGSLMTLPLEIQQLDIPRRDDMMKRAEDYKQFWGRDPYSGGRIK